MVINEVFYNTNDLADEFIHLVLTKTIDAQPEKHWVPAYYFDIYNNENIKIGSCDLRIGHNEKTYIGGNIGYKIDEPYRGHRYAAKAVFLLLKLAKKHNLGYVIITCDPKNIASSRTCEISGGELIEKAAVPKDNELYNQGQKEVLIYKIFI